VGAVDRALAWDGCFNVRDLGGLETAAGTPTRRGVIVRADNVRRLTPAGWDSALAHGIRRVVDLRFEDEGSGEGATPDSIEVVGISLFGRHDPEIARAFDERVRNGTDIAVEFAVGYIHTLENGSERVAAAVAAVADAPASDGIVVHCAAGKDRTGIVTSLLLGVAGVADDLVAADYAASGPGVEALLRDWIDAAEDDDELALRKRLVQAPEATMVAVLAWLRDSAGGASAYLRHAGLTDGQLEQLQARLVGA